MRTNDLKKIKEIARLLVETNTDIKWDIENLEPNSSIWMAGFIEGARLVTEFYDKAIDNITTEDIGLK